MASHWVAMPLNTVSMFKIWTFACFVVNVNVLFVHAQVERVKLACNSFKLFSVVLPVCQFSGTTDLWSQKNVCKTAERTPSMVYTLLDFKTS